MNKPIPPWSIPLAVVAAIAVILAPGSQRSAHAKPAPSPSPSPTTPPTPYMPPDQVTNGVWEVIMQGDEYTYSTMKLKDDGDKVSGVWLYDNRTVYQLSGTRKDTHLDLQITRPGPTPTVIGSIDATLDGIADMVGTITLGGKAVPFQGAQHSRVPPPVEPSNAPVESPTPFS